MMATPEGAAYLLEGVIRSPLLLSSPASFSGENLDLLVRQRWRQWRHSLVGGVVVNCFADFGAMGCLPYPPCSGVAAAATISCPSDPAFASSSPPSLLVAQVAFVRRMLCRLAG